MSIHQQKSALDSVYETENYRYSGTKGDHLYGVGRLTKLSTKEQFVLNPQNHSLAACTLAAIKYTFESQAVSIISCHDLMDDYLDGLYHLSLYQESN
ncbi:hypothetical protein [Pseudanabaena sp. 'Roaring Creek']|uniref:hypothetical protein n=1 Tax=Pseudanabaena sp. 'Roaring Creek' TaxID=1681830 RepID=UPI0006D7CD64|nr:hypothetical protein [Pseudanabaena sp. 'Roaring Creek']